MSYHEYCVSIAIDRHNYPFYALIMAAMRRADTCNMEHLKIAFPAVYRELERRYHALGGQLPEDDISSVSFELRDIGEVGPTGPAKET